MADGSGSSTTVYFNVFTTTGTLQIISTSVQGVTGFYTEDSAGTALDGTGLKPIYDTYHSNVLYTYFTSEHANSLPFDISCEFSGDLSTKRGLTATEETQLACLEKGDLVFLLNALTVDEASVGRGATKDAVTIAATGDGLWEDLTSNLNNNPKYLNMYRIAKIGREYNYYDGTGETDMVLRNKITFEQSINFAYTMDFDDGSSGAAYNDATTGLDVQRTARIYKFTPPATTIQNTYAAECSTRGICNREDGVCECFAGYTGDSCNMQNALAE